MNSYATISLLGGACVVGAVAFKFYSQIGHLRELLAQERVGRTKAERALRERKQEQLQLEGHVFNPIGYVDSCFPGRCGAPRQGILAPSTRARLVLSSHISPFAIEGLQEYSHLWVVFVFDENTNACSDKGKSAQSRTFPAKVAPPQLHGKRVGLFSTRTPHRPNAIGLTVVKVISVDIQRRSILVGGIDLVHETPILDVKPYIPSYDCLVDAECPRWVTEGGSPELHVVIADGVREQFSQLHLPKSSLFTNHDDLLRALSEVLRLDIRSTYQGRGPGKPGSSIQDNVKSEPKQDYEFHFDCLRVRFKTGDAMVTVVSLELEDTKKQRYKGANSVPAES